MIVYKFGGATTRSKRGIEALVRLVKEAHTKEMRRSNRRKRASEDALDGLIIVVSAMGHTTRYLQRAAESSQQGDQRLAEDFVAKILSQHSQLVRSLKLDGEEHIVDRFESIAEEARALLEGIYITRELSRRTRDAILVQGERFAIALIEGVLREEGLPVRTANVSEIIITDENYGSAQPIVAEIEERAWQHIVPRLRRSEIVLLQGFAGATRDGITTTMGRESSDLTATLLAGVLNAEEVVIWKTVPGIFSADPELVPGAKLLRTLSFNEAEELGRRGARILHPSIAHPLQSEDNKTVLRVADPFARGSRNTLLQRVIAKPRAGAIGLVLEQHLIPLVLRPKRDVSSTELLASTRLRRERTQSIRHQALYRWSTGSAEIILVRREEKLRAVARLTPEYDIYEESPVSTLSLVIRPRDQSSFLAASGQLLRGLRTVGIRALIPIENSIVAVLVDEDGVAALRKAHSLIFSK